MLPFTLHETEEFLKSRSIRLKRDQIVELYMTMGGVPHYLKEAERGQSAAQIIDRTCFAPQGLLTDEFEKLYASLFRYSDQNIAIIKAMMKKTSGMTRTETLEKAKFSSGGTATKRFEELEESGFIQRLTPFGGKANDALFRVADEFSLFHLKWMAARQRRAIPGDWLAMRGTPAWRAWSGYAFEAVCLKHIPEIKRALGIGAVQTAESSWRFVPGKNDSEAGAQIDLVIDRADSCVNICEMKFSETPFQVAKRYADDLRRKRQVFQRKTKTRKTIFQTLIAPHRLAPNDHSVELISEALALDCLFERRG